MVVSWPLDKRDACKVASFGWPGNGLYTHDCKVIPIFTSDLLV